MRVQQDALRASVLMKRRSMRSIELWPSGTLPHPPSSSVAKRTIRLERAHEAEASEGTSSRKREKGGARSADRRIPCDFDRADQCKRNPSLKPRRE
jgi:hypothetical protein